MSIWDIFLIQITTASDLQSEEMMNLCCFANRICDNLLFKQWETKSDGLLASYSKSGPLRLGPVT